jgi:hypothetical protein
MKKQLRNFWNFVLWASGLSEEPSVEYKQIDEDVKVTKRERHTHGSSGYGGNPTLSRILHQEGSGKDTFETIFEGPSGKIISNKEKGFEDLWIGDKVRVSYDQAYLITFDFVYPNFSEKRETKRERAYYADNIKSLTKLVD